MRPNIIRALLLVTVACVLTYTHIYDIRRARRDGFIEGHKKGQEEAKEMFLRLRNPK